MVNILVSLHRGYGVGDACQMSAVLRHLRKHRPEWCIDYQAEEGKHQVGHGIVTSHFAYGTPYPHDRYDAEVQIVLYDTWEGFCDRPNTRVSSCLRDCFGLGWDEECGRYEVNVPEQVALRAKQLMPGLPGRYVALHYRGDSATEQKDLTHEQAAGICTTIRRAGACPFLLDWRGKWPLHEEKVTPGLHGRDIAINCAVISRVVAYVGIDSGPSKCASATSTPSLVIWKGHHPAPFHDPAPNTTHLVPQGYHAMRPVYNDPGVIDFFEAHYQVRAYQGDPVSEVERWLAEVLE